MYNGVQEKSSKQIVRYIFHTVGYSSLGGPAQGVCLLIHNGIFLSCVFTLRLRIHAMKLK